jgi:hypothetical protein
MKSLRRKGRISPPFSRFNCEFEQNDEGATTEAETRAYIAT